MMRKALIALSAIALIGAAVGGCGGDGSEEAQASPLTKKQFVERLGAFCKKTEQEKFDLIGVAFRAQVKAEPGWEPDDKDLEEATVNVVLPVIEKVPERILEMSPPVKDQEKVNAMAEAFEADIEKTRADPDRFVEGVAFSEGNKMAEAYGIPLCIF